MPKFTKKSKNKINEKVEFSKRRVVLDRSARNAPTRPTTRASALAAEEAAANEDAMSVCSNVSDQTSIYDEVEGKFNTKKNNEILI